MSLELLGCDEIGADTVRVYTDADTVRAVQQFLHGVGGGKAFPVFNDPRQIDGRLGPNTNAAVRKFNADYRGKPEDREFITDGTLSSMGIEPSATPAEVIVDAAAPPSAKPSKPSPSALVPQAPEAVTATVDEGWVAKLKADWWKVALAALGVALLGIGIVAAVSGRGAKAAT